MSVYPRLDKKKRRAVRRVFLYGLLRPDAMHEAIWGAHQPDKKPDDVPSLPWTWTGGYPQRITGPDATLIAETYESPDTAAVVAPLICKAVNAYFGVSEQATYDVAVGVKQIRGTHPYSFRSGEWATILTIALTPVVGTNGRVVRECYLVQFDDGVKDYLPVVDPDAAYEFRTVQDG